MLFVFSLLILLAEARKIKHGDTVQAVCDVDGSGYRLTSRDADTWLVCTPEDDPCDGGCGAKPGKLARYVQVIKRDKLISLTPGGWTKTGFITRRVLVLVLGLFLLDVSPGQGRREVDSSSVTNTRGLDELIYPGCRVALPRLKIRSLRIGISSASFVLRLVGKFEYSCLEFFSAV